MLDFVYKQFESIWYSGICKFSKFIQAIYYRFWLKLQCVGELITNNNTQRELCPHICKLTLMLCILEALVQVAAVYIQTLIMCRMEV